MGEPVNSRLVFQRTVRPVSTPSWLIPLVSSSSSSVSTRWTPPSHHTPSLVSRRSRRRCLVSSRRSATTPPPFPSSPSPDGTETTCWSSARGPCRDRYHQARYCVHLRPSPTDH